MESQKRFRINFRAVRHTYRHNLNSFNYTHFLDYYHPVKLTYAWNADTINSLNFSNFLPSTEENLYIIRSRASHVVVKIQILLYQWVFLVMQHRRKTLLITHVDSHTSYLFTEENIIAIIYVTESLSKYAHEQQFSRLLFPWIGRLSLSIAHISSGRMA